VQLLDCAVSIPDRVLEKRVIGKELRVFRTAKLFL